MPGPMPYSLEKGPALSILESFLNDQPNSVIMEALSRLRAIDANGRHRYPVTDCGAFDTISLDFTPPGATKKMDSTAWKRHLNHHWFGRINDAGKPVDPKAASSLYSAASWWVGYWADDVEGIVRETMVRAIETAYRIPHGGSIKTAAKRWPIEMFWKCGQQWFEGWVTWRALPGTNAGGLVTAMWATPAENTGKHFLWWSPEPLPKDAGGRSDPYDKGVDRLGLERQGMVVITHQQNVPVTHDTEDVVQQMRGSLTPPPPGAPFHGTGPVVVVRPAEVRGGVASRPRQWEPKK